MLFRSIRVASLTLASVVLSLALAGTSWAQGTAKGETKDALPVAKKNLEEKKAVLFDVREQGEWDAGHLATAKLMPLSKLKAGAKPGAADAKEGTIVYCHCKAGKRAVEAAALLRKMGYDARPLAEGYDALLKAGFEKAK